jgi:hypothetical protein
MLVILLGSIAVAIALVATFFTVNRPQYVEISAGLPANFPNEGFSHEAFESLLARYVDSQGNVNYAAWHASVSDRNLLDGYLAAVAAFSPDSAPDRFNFRSEKLAYWIYAYNAYVIRTVLQNWPIDSVTDLKAPIEAVTGLGFFYRARYQFGREALSLYAVEHQKILAEFQDPRIHFVLNCASESCPTIRPQLPTGADLEILLEEKTVEFINDENNVFIDHEHRRIVLSTIFKWYRKDFVNALRREGRPATAGLLDYVFPYLKGHDKAALDLATSYEVVFSDYDWSLNRSTEH